MTQQSLDAIALYEGVVQQMLPVLGGVRADQLGASTPCTEWNVQNLIIHNLKVAAFTCEILQGDVTTNPSEVGDPIPSQGARGAFESSTTRVLDLLKSAGDLHQDIGTPFGSMSITDFITLPVLDILVHKWDLAKSTGQDTTLDSGLSEVCYGVLQANAEAWRPSGAYGAEVTIPMAASIQNKLLALSGRTP